MKTIQTLNSAPENSIRTHSGAYVNLLNPKPETIILSDIIWALSHEVRWNGHQMKPVTVGEHTLICMKIGMNRFMERDREKMMALFVHDFSEAYLKDIPTPLKKLLPNYKALERNMMSCICLAIFGDPNLYSRHEEFVKDIDQEALEREWYNFMGTRTTKKKDVRRKLYEQYENLSNL